MSTEGKDPNDEKDESTAPEGTDSTESDASDESSEKSEASSDETDESTEGHSDSSEENDDDDESDDEESDEDDSEEEQSEEDVAEAKGAREERGSSASLLIGVLALAAGFGIGWFGHDYQGQKAVRAADAAVQGTGDGARGPCKDWESKLCSHFGETAFACVQAKSASPLLSGSACEQATKGIDGKIKAIEAERAPCTNLADKLCGELGAESASCGLVKSQTPSFPPQRCDDMMKNYDQVLGQLKMMEQRGAIPGAGGPHGGPPGGPPGAGPRRVGPSAPPGHPPVSSGPTSSGPSSSGPTPPPKPPTPPAQ